MDLTPDEYMLAQELVQDGDMAVATIKDGQATFALTKAGRLRAIKAIALVLGITPADFLKSPAPVQSVLAKLVFDLTDTEG